MNVEKELRQLGVQPVEGQNFLTSEAVVQALVEAGEVEDQKVLEIGAGTGFITEKLEEKAEKLYALERDAKLHSHLEEKFSGSGKVQVLNEDILDWDFPDLDRCVSNLPFQISSEIIELLGRKQIQSSLIVQDELAEKIVAKPGESRYNYFTVLVNYYFIPVKLRKVSSSNYYPAPNVDTAIIKLYPNKERHGIGEEEFFFEAVKALFTHKRKKVRNAFVDARHILDLEKEKAKELQDRLPHSEERVVDLDIRQLSEITDEISANI